jgi:hypothetical protein
MDLVVTNTAGLHWTRTDPASGSGISRSASLNGPFAASICTTRIFLDVAAMELLLV